MEAVKVLLALGADPLAMTCIGQNALQMAQVTHTCTIKSGATIRLHMSIIAGDKVMSVKVTNSTTVIRLTTS